MKLLALARVGRNVADLATAQKFYSEALGFQPVGPVTEDEALAEILRVHRVRVLRMRLGAQEIELSECFPGGEPCPLGGASNDLSFQHIAVVTADMAAAYEQVMGLGATAISVNGPQRLPASSGGVTVFKFRDPEGHPVELLEFPAGNGKPIWQRDKKLMMGFDHSAISISDTGRSVAFYTDLGLSQAARQLNQGDEQDALDALPAVRVDVVALEPPQNTPHVELLCYHHPAPNLAARSCRNDILADRLVFSTTTGKLSLHHDPDRHMIILDGRASGF